MDNISITAVLAAVIPMLTKVIVVILFLHKNSLNIIYLALLLLFANVASLAAFIVLHPSLFDRPPDFLRLILWVGDEVFAYTLLVIVLDLLVLAIASKLSVFRKPGGSPLTYARTLVAVLIGTVIYIILGFSLVVSFTPMTPAPPDVVEINVSGQGTWESTLEARDFDNDMSTIEGYYDTTLNITWLMDANYSGEAMTWINANAWSAGLDINGITGWRLPMERPLNGVAFDSTYSDNATTDFGEAPASTDGSDGGWRNAAGNPVSEMGHMFYVTLGNRQDADVIQQLTNTGPFSNVQSTFYWSGTEPGPESVVPGPMFDPTAKMALAFYFSYGTRGALAQTARGPAWIVHDGDVGTSIPK